MKLLLLTFQKGFILLGCTFQIRTEKSAQCSEREHQIQNKNIWKMVKNYYRSINFERTFWYPQILPKNKRTSSFIVLLGKNHKFICSFFGRIVGLKKHFDSFWILKSFNIFATYGVFNGVVVGLKAKGMPGRMSDGVR